MRRGPSRFEHLGQNDLGDFGGKAEFDQVGLFVFFGSVDVAIANGYEQCCELPLHFGQIITTLCHLDT